MFVPEVLAAVGESLIGHDRIARTGPWTSDADGQWRLPIRAQLSAAESAWMPSETNWFVVFDPSTNSVKVFPAKVDGISTTFQHQSFNEEGPAGTPWRLGNPCLHRQIAAFGRTSWRGEPEAIGDKISWYLERLLLWIDAAAAEELAVEGEPFELPSGPAQKGFPLIGFVGADDDPSFWIARRNDWGWADLARLPVAQATSAVTVFRDRRHNPIRDQKWGRLIASMKPSMKALWIALDKLPVLPPWELPRTWAALSSQLASEGVDLRNIFEQAGIDRRDARDTSPLRLLLGFPIAKTIGDTPSRYHWVAIDSLELSGRSSRKNGFRAIEKNWRFMDRQRPTATTPLTWLKTANWEPDEIRTRAGIENDVPSRRVLMIGAGSLGSGIAENLVRMGMTEMAILDYDRLDVGNLTRHSLGMDAVGHNKANALAHALSLQMPDANVHGIASSFPPTNVQTAETVRSFDVVVDCTGSDEVLDAMSAFDWGGEKIFVSLAMTWRAEGMLVFTATESSFPAIDAKDRFAEIDVPPSDLGEARMEGIGCWHPVFPASTADVGLWSAIGSKAILNAIRVPGRSCTYFRQNSDATVERLDV